MEVKDKKIDSKKRNLIIIIIILLILFIYYGISFKSTPESREKKILSYLKKKYNSEFKIARLIDSGENVLIPEISCDGSTFCEGVKQKDVYYYTYEVISVSDNIRFEVKYLDKKLNDRITEEKSYFSLKNTGTFLKDVSKYVIDTIGDSSTVIESQRAATENGDYSSISIKIDKDLDNIFNSKYISKIKKINSYIDSKEALDNDIDIFVYIAYNNNIEIWFDYGEPKVKEVDNNGVAEKEYTLEEYLERVKK